VSRVLAIALAAAALGTSVARAEPGDPSASGFEGEIGLGVVYSTSDAIGLGLYTGFSFAKPVLGLCYLEPLVELEIDFTASTRVTGKLRCNFVTAVGHELSLGLGAGFGQHAGEDSDFNMTSTPMSFREVEIGMKLGGKRRFLIALAYAFDGTIPGANAWMLQTTIVKAMP
jgi:hypothetical protein